MTSNYGLGLDLGSGSVGWATVELDGKGKAVDVERMGVRRFDAGVSGDIDGGRDESNAAVRRSKRGPRKLHWRRGHRMRRLFGLLSSAGLLPHCDIVTSEGRRLAIIELDQQLRVQHPAANHAAESLLPYRLRALALDRVIDAQAVGRAIYSIAQRRGFQSNRKATSEDDAEEGIVKKSIAELDELMRNAGVRTLGEFFASIDPEEVNLRRRWTARRMYQDEFDQIWTAQAPHHAAMTDELKRKIERAIFHQRPLKSQRNLVGRCELEKHPRTDAEGETRYVGRRCAFLACLPYQEFRLLQKVNDLSFTFPDGQVGRLSDPDYAVWRSQLLEKLSEQGEISFGAIRKLFGLKKSKEYGRDTVFNFETDGDAKLVGNRTAAKMIKKLGPIWHAMSDEKQNRLVDEMLQFESSDALKRRLLSAFEFDESVAGNLSKIVLEQGFGRLSRRAIRRLLPHMRDGLNFHDAKEACGYNTFTKVEAVDVLPPVIEAMPEVRNPAAIRVLTEMRKVVNAIIREHDGHPPQWIRVELARELKHSRKRRKELQKQNRKNQKDRERAAKTILTAMSDDERYVTRDNILKIRLWEECGGVCPYTGVTIGIAALVGDEPQFEIEHTIPFSKSLDNSFLNKTLCRTDYNRRKGNQTPWKAFGGTDEYEEILQRVRMFRGDAREAKLKRFQVQSLDDFDGFVSRQLNDTRYAARAAAQYLSQLYGGDVVDGTRRVFATPGRITAYLRQRWNLNSLIGHPDEKNRADHRHHAIDALVTALSTPSAVKTLTDAARDAEDTGQKLFGDVEPPFPGLLQQAREIVAGIKISSRSNRKLNGPLHEETFYSPPKQVGEDKAGHPIMVHHVRKPLVALSPGDVSDIVDKRVRWAVQESLERCGLPPKDAFKDPNQLPHLHGKNGRTTPIRRVRIQKRVHPMAIGEESSTRYVNPGANHHMVIVAVLDKQGKEKKWEGHLVARFEAMDRLRRKQEVIQTNFGEGRVTKFVLHGGDHMLIDRGDGDELCRVVTLSGQNLELVFHSNANPSTVRKKTPGERIRLSASSLQFANARKVDVTPAGQVVIVSK